MTWAIWVGRILFALSMAALGVLNLIDGAFVLGVEPVPEAAPLRDVLPYLSGALLLLGGLAQAHVRTARFGALALALVLFVWCAALHAPRLIADPNQPGALSAGFETFALFGAALLLAAALEGSPPLRESLFAKLGVVGRCVFAVSLPVFGLQHFQYVQAFADLIPAYMPFGVFWAYFTGAAHIAAGLGILTGVLSQLAASLLSAMFTLFIVLVHIPRVIADSANRQEWTSLLVATALTGGAWLLAGMLARRARALQNHAA